MLAFPHRADPGKFREIIRAAALLLLQDKGARNVENADGITIRPRAIELSRSF
jgi:hypothetical protein